MLLAWRIFRSRRVGGSNVKTFADAMRNAWSWVKRQALPPVPAGPTLHLRSMLRSPIRRSLGGRAYAGRMSWDAGRVTSGVGA